MLSDRLKWILVHSTRTAVVAVASLLVARFFGLPEAVLGADYNFGDHPIIAGCSTVCFLAAFRRNGGWRLSGRDCGKLLRTSCARIRNLRIHPGIASRTWSDLTAYRFGSVTLAVVLLVPRTGPAWQIAFHRFAEVSIGIGVALILAIVWPEREATPSEKS